MSFYLDAVGFTYKTNPCDQARSPGAMLWRRANEGLEVGCTAKGQKEGTKQVHFICAISHGKGVICCEQYEGKMSGELFANFVDENFEQVFQKSCNPRAKRFLQDGCPEPKFKEGISFDRSDECKTIFDTTKESRFEPYRKCISLGKETFAIRRS